MDNCLHVLYNSPHCWRLDPNLLKKQLHYYTSATSTKENELLEHICWKKDSIYWMQWGCYKQMHIVADILPIGNNVTGKKDNRQACSLKDFFLERELVFFKWNNKKEEKKKLLMKRPKKLPSLIS